MKIFSAGPTAALLAALTAGTGAEAQTRAQDVIVQGKSPSTSDSTTKNAQGISANPNAGLPGQTGFSPISTPISTPPQSGLFPGAGRFLLDHGFDFHGLVADHYLNNPSSGTKPGNDENLTVIRLVLDVDLGDAIGLRGSAFHVADTVFTGLHNYSSFVTETGGAINGYQTTPLSRKSTLTTLTYEQNLLSGRLSIEAGRTNPHRYFFIPNSIDPFTNDSTTIYLDGDVNSYPFSRWGGRVTFHLSPKWYLQGGAFEDNYRGSILHPYDFSTEYSSGVISIGEVGYRSDFTNSAYPGNLEVGFLYNDRTGASNIKGTSADYSKFIDPNGYAKTGIIFAQGAQTIWRGPAQGPDRPPRNVSLYGSASVATDQPQPISWDTLVGVNVTGLLSFRPRDVFEVQMRYQKLSNTEASNETRLRRIADPASPAQETGGLMIEAISKIVLNNYMSVSPLVEYFHDPDNYFFPNVNHTQPKNGFMFGVYAALSLGPLSGTSRKPF